MTIIIITIITLTTKQERRSKQHKNQAITRFINRIAIQVSNIIESLVPSLKTKTKNKGYHKFRRRTKIRTRRICLALTTKTRPQPKRGSPFDSDSELIGIDNRCSLCISHVLQDFPDGIQDCDTVIKGFGGNITDKVYKGTIHWNWEDDEGISHLMIIPNSLYVENGSRLLSPQHWAQERNGKDKRDGAGAITTGNNVTLFWDSHKYTKTVPINKRGNNVASFRMSNGYQNYQAYCATTKTDDPGYDDNPENINKIMAISSTIKFKVKDNQENPPEDLKWPHPDLNNSTKFSLNGPDTEDTEEEEDERPKKRHKMTTNEGKLLQLHYDFGHLPFTKLREMARQGILPSVFKDCEVPFCSACAYAKITKCAWRPKTSKIEDKTTKSTTPGKVVSVDMLVSQTPGLIAQMTGFITKQRYRYATVYVDQATGFGFTYLQQTASAAETLQSKLAFERCAATHGVKIQAYHADNGIFKARDWVEACQKKNQPLTFAAVGAHHQNGKAERRIRELQDMARTMLLHANQRWPNAITANLWPYAIRQANECINASPNMQDKTRQSPLQLFSTTKVHIKYKHWKPFGCPVFVLEEPLQSGTTWDKWKSRARLGIYLGQSPLHNRNVALVMNKNTGHVSPQFHVKFDTKFHTLAQDEVATTWQEHTFFGKTKNNIVTKDKASPDQAATPTVTNSETRRDINTTLTHLNSSHNLEVTNTLDDGLVQQNEPQDVRIQREQPNAQPTLNPVVDENTDNHESTNANMDVSLQRSTDQFGNPVRRSIRTRRPPERLTYTTTTVDGEYHPVITEIFCLETLFPHDTTSRLEHPMLAYKATSDPDTMYHHQAMKQPDWPQFRQAMQQEMDNQMEDGNYSIIRRSEVPPGNKILKSVWAMKRKRDLRTGEVKKWKARLNIDGSMMIKGDHYDQTYAPVAAWSSIRLMLAMAATFNWHTVQLDYVQAYSQAPVERELYMEIPLGYNIEGKQASKDYVLKLHGNTYGQKQAGRVWFQHLKTKLVKKVGFTQSKVDECIFYKGKVVYVLYTDDSILTGPNKQEIEQVIKDIEKAKLKITSEGEVKDFLGVQIDRQKDGSIKFTQTLLINKILKELRLDGDSIKTQKTPAASSKILLRHSASKDFDGNFNYRSVIGMLNYLDTGTRSDIAYATHQCARYTIAPKTEHGKAVKWIGRYLKGTKTKGMIFKPNIKAGLEVFVDADFSGSWDKIEAADDRDTACSRHGYIIRYMGCPIIWKSQLQTEIALSSTESEYTGLSYALRDAIPIMELLKEMKAKGFEVTEENTKVHCRVFEDNMGALKMVKTHKFRPRTKHINVKLHHFRDYVDSGEITIEKIASEDQLADYLTKPLDVKLLQKLRKLVMGW